MAVQISAVPLAPIVGGVLLSLSPKTNPSFCSQLFGLTLRGAALKNPAHGKFREASPPPSAKTSRPPISAGFRRGRGRHRAGVPRSVSAAVAGVFGDDCFRR